MKRQATFYATTADGDRRRFDITPAVDSPSPELAEARRQASERTTEEWRRVNGVSVSGDDHYIVTISAR